MAGERLILRNPSVTFFGSEPSDEMRSAILAQGLSAVVRFPRERRSRHQDFRPFVFFTHPESPRFMVGDIVGWWDRSGDTFRLESITVIDEREDLEDMIKLMGLIAHLNPGVPKIYSDSFGQRFEQRQQTLAAESLSRTLVPSGTQESALFGIE